MHSAMSTPKRIVSRMSNGNPPDDFAGLVCTAGGFSSTVDDAFSETSLTTSPPPLHGTAVLVGSLRKLRSHHYLATFHHHVQNGRLGEILGRRLGEDSTLTHDQHAVGQPEHLGHLAGHQHH